MDPKGLNQPLNIQSNHKQSNKRKKFVICGCLLILLILISVIIGLHFDTIPIRHEWSSQQINFNYNCHDSLDQVVVVHQVQLFKEMDIFGV